MKLIKITSLALITGYLLAGTGCTRKIDEFGDINQNPGIVSSPNYSALFTNALSGTGAECWSVTPGLYAQLYSETQYTEASRYTRTAPSFGGYYSGPLNDLKNIMDNAPNPKHVAAARILKAWWFLRVTDAWGDVPYFQALNFNGEIPYDDQQAIYADLFDELEDALAGFTGTDPLTGDILMQGDVDMWKRFANSLRMIMAIRLSSVDANLGKTEFLSAFNNSAGYITNNSQDVKLAYPGGNYSSVFYSYYNITLRSDYAISQTVTNHMNANNDSRINAWGSSTKGFPYGYTRDDAIAWTNAGNADWARIMHPSIRTATQPMPILTASQVTLARAEAAQRGWTAENVANLYALGIEQNWRQWGVYQAPALTAYLLDPDIALTPGTELAKIIQQRWFAAFPDGQEAWNIWRSTGLPNLIPAPGTGLQIPKRFGIAQQHYNLNTANTNAVAEKYKVAGEADSQYGRPWWVKP